MYNSIFLPRQTLTSVINDGCDIRSALYSVIKFFDPQSSQNRKSTLLDCTYSAVLTEEHLRFFKSTKTNNLTGYVRNKNFDIILYEPPKNKNFLKATEEYSKSFSSMLNKNGVVIVRTNDFKEKGKDRLRGSFDIQQSFHSQGLYLTDQIIYIPPRHKESEYHNISLIHYYFMIFKKA